MSSEPVIITGVGKRVGYHLAKHFLSKGVSVLGIYRSHYPEITELMNQGADLVQCDLMDKNQFNQLIEYIKQNYQGLRAIIHNASDWIQDQPDHTEAGNILDKMMGIHVSVPYRLNLALEHLLQASQSAQADIIHIGDYVSARGSSKHIAYAASKAAQDNLTYSFASKLAPRVKVNSLSPALIAFQQDDQPAYREKTLHKSLLRKEGGYQEILKSVNYLLESQYVTGRILPIDGGRHLQ